MKVRIKQPRKFVAILLIVYITGMLFIIEKNFEERSAFKQITGRGTGIVQVNILPSCNIPVASGYNLISLCANMTNTSVESVLRSIEGKYLFILQWNNSRQEFDIYSPGAVDNAFTEMTINQSYFLFINEPGTITMQGNELGDMNITVGNEFSAASYAYIFETNITKYTNSTGSNVTFILKWDTDMQEFTVFSTISLVNDVYSISRGEGQFTYSTVAGTVIRYNKTALRP